MRSTKIPRKFSFSTTSLVVLEWYRMRYPRRDGKRRQDTSSHAEQSARLENRRSKGSSHKVRNRISPAGDESRDVSQSGRRGRRGSGFEANQTSVRQKVRGADRQLGQVRVTKKLLEQYPFQIRLLTEEEGGGYLIEFPEIP